MISMHYGQLFLFILGSTLHYSTYLAFLIASYTFALFFASILLEQHCYCTWLDGIIIVVVVCLPSDNQCCCVLF